MIRWLKKMLLLNIRLVPPMVFLPAICLTSRDEMCAARPLYPQRFEREDE